MVVTDTLPAVLSISTATTTRGIITVAGQTLTGGRSGAWSRGMTCASRWWRRSPARAQPGDYTNTAAVTTSSAEQATDNNTAQAPANVVREPTALPAAPTAAPGAPTAGPDWRPTAAPGTPTEASLAPTAPATAGPPTQPPPSPPTRVPPAAISRGNAAEGDCGHRCGAAGRGVGHGMAWLLLAMACWLLAGGSLMQLRRLEQDAKARPNR